MSLSGSSKRLDYEASAGWTTYGTWRAPCSLFQGAATRHEGSSENSGQWAVGSEEINTTHCPLSLFQGVAIRPEGSPVRLRLLPLSRLTERLDIGEKKERSESQIYHPSAEAMRL